MDIWYKRAWTFQQDQYQTLSNKCWDKLDNNGLSQKIECAIDLCYKESSESEANIDKVIIAMREYYRSGPILFSCSYVNAKIEKTGHESVHCVFWATTEENVRGVCFDAFGRRYSDWDDYKENNTLAGCHLIYPVTGKYTQQGLCERYCAELACETKYLGLISQFKSQINIAASAAAATCTIALFLNPGSAIAAGGMFGGSLVRTCFAYQELRDNYRHERFDLQESNTQLALVDMVFSAIGTVAGGTICYKGLKSVTSLTSECAIVSAGNVALRFVEACMNFVKSGCSYLKNKLTSLLCSAFNIRLSSDLLFQLMSYIKSMSIETVIDNIRVMKKAVFQKVKTVIDYVHDLTPVLENLFPLKNILSSPCMRPISSTFHFLDNIPTNVKKDPVRFVRYMLTNLPRVFQDIDAYLNRSRVELVRTSDTATCNMIEEWVREDGIDCNENMSSFDSKYNFPTYIKEMVTDALKLAGRDEFAGILPRKERDLTNFIINILHRHDLKSFEYEFKKVEFYCGKFKQIFTRLMESHYFEYFLYVIKHRYVRCRETFFKERMQLSYHIVDHVFTTSIAMLGKCIDDFDLEYVTLEQSRDYIANNEDGNLIFKFEEPKGTVLDEPRYYDIAVRLLPPQLSCKIKNENYSFENQLVELAIISTDTFKLMFYTFEDICLKGILIYTPNSKVDVDDKNN